MHTKEWAERLEAIILAQWPALSTMDYEGWLIRMAGGYTKRSNSVSPIQGEPADLEEAVAECERQYRGAGLRPAFKLTPAVRPQGLDAELDRLGYRLMEPSYVMQRELAEVPAPVVGDAVIAASPSSDWLEAYSSWSRLQPEHRNAMEQVLAAIPSAAGYIVLYQDGKPAACGLGVVEQGWLGLYDIVTHPSLRNRGLAEQMILHLLQWGRAQGATHSLLAVLQSNGPALRLYEKLGYSHCYDYWYRVKD